MTVLAQLVESVQDLGRPEWRPMLKYVAELHARSTHPPRTPFPYPWEEIGPGYCHGPAFGHWDLIHAVFDTMPFEPEHARQQLLNLLALQGANGMLPGAVWMPREGDPTRSQPRWSTAISHPPVWPIAAQAYIERFGDDGLVALAYESLVRQLRWFETHRRAEPFGFYYADILTFNWESGVDEGARFHSVQPGPFACVDATAHLYAAYTIAEIWAVRLGADAEAFGERADTLGEFIRGHLFCEETGFFHDIWSVRDPENRPMAHEGMWPLVVGAATPGQAQRVIDENLLSPRRFFSFHPITTVGMEDPLFELRMWRGPTWNSMTYWAALGCCRYGRADAARALLERALCASAVQFERTGTIWEFYHPHGGEPEVLRRKPHTAYNTPCRDYLGHNPLIAMAHLLEMLSEQGEKEI